MKKGNLGIEAINYKLSVTILPLQAKMFLRPVIFFSVVCLACCETKKNSEDPPLLEALNAKYFGHIRGKRTVSLKTEQQTSGRVNCE